MTSRTTHKKKHMTELYLLSINLDRKSSLFSLPSSFSFDFFNLTIEQQKSNYICRLHYLGYIKRSINKSNIKTKISKKKEIETFACFCCSDWTKLKHRKFMGQLTEQYIRVRAKPFIVEVDQTTNNTEPKMFV